MKKWIVNSTLVLATVALLVFLAFHVRVTPAANEVAVLKTIGMSCGSCAARISKALESKEGVGSVLVDIETGKVTVLHDSQKIDAEQVASVVTDAGYPSSVERTGANDVFEKETGSIANVKKTQTSGCDCCNKARK